MKWIGGWVFNFQTIDMGSGRGLSAVYTWGIGIPAVKSKEAASMAFWGGIDYMGFDSVLGKEPVFCFFLLFFGHTRTMMDPA